MPLAEPPHQNISQSDGLLLFLGDPQQSAFPGSHIPNSAGTVEAVMDWGKHILSRIVPIVAGHNKGESGPDGPSQRPGVDRGAQGDVAVGHPVRPQPKPSQGPCSALQPRACPPDTLQRRRHTPSFALAHPSRSLRCEMLTHPLRHTGHLLVVVSIVPVAVFVLPQLDINTTITVELNGALHCSQGPCLDFQVFAWPETVIVVLFDVPSA